MTITTAVWLLTLTFSGTDIALIRNAPFATSKACIQAGTTVGQRAIRLSGGMYLFTVECVEEFTTRVSL